MNNPLSSYINKPGIHVRLPSAGKFYNHSPKLTADGDIEIHPLTAIDELYLKNPDGLYNNESLFKVLKTTVPSIPFPQEIPTADLDVLLIGMRIATYGNTIDVTVRCEKCNEVSDYQIDLNNIIAAAKTMPDSNTLEIDGLVLTLKPYTLETNARLSEYTLAIAQVARKAQIEAEKTGNSEKLKQEIATAMNESSAKLIALTSKCIVSITLPDETVVTDEKHIYEFVSSLSAPKYAKIRDALMNLSAEVINRKFSYVCPNEKCKHENTGEVSFDPANFFE